VAEKGILEAVENWGPGWEALDGGDGLAFHLADCHEAGADGFAVNEDCASAAIASIAAHFGPG
jgi:hypothetical protein